MNGENDKPEFNRDIFISNDKNGNPTIINTRLFSNEIIKKYHFKTISETDKILYYKNGYYKNGATPLIKKICEETFPDIINNRKISEIIGHIQRSTYIHKEEINTESKILNLENGLLNVETEEFIEHTPKKIISIRIPIEYNPKSVCTGINNFLSEIVAKKDIPILEEIAGYCLYRRYFIKKGFLFNGGGDNGKGIYLAILRKLLGKENYSTISLQRLSSSSDRFSSSFLVDKMANIYGDLSSEGLKDTGTFKMLTGGDSIPAEIKGGGLFTFINFAKLIFSANTIPDTDDITDAYMDRWIIIDFPYKFVSRTEEELKESEKIKINEELLLDKITTPNEMSGFLNVALKALKRLLTNREFSYSINTEENKDRYKRKSNVIYGFVKNCCEIEPEGQISKADIYNVYIEYCKVKKQPAVEIFKFGKELQKNISIIETHPYSDDLGKQVKAWKGLRLKNNITNITTITTFPLFLSSQKKVYREVVKEKSGNSSNTSIEEEIEIELEELENKE